MRSDDKMIYMGLAVNERISDFSLSGFEFQIFSLPRKGKSLPKINDMASYEKLMYERQSMIAAYGKRVA